MHLKPFALLPFILCFATAARINSYSGSILKPNRNSYNYEDFVLGSFGYGKHYDALKTTRSPVDSASKQTLGVQPNGQGKSTYSQLPENEPEGGTGATWSAESSGRIGQEVEQGAPAYGSVGTVGIGSSGRSFGVPLGGSQGGGFAATAFGGAAATGFAKSGGFSGHGAQSGSFGSQIGSYGGQSGSHGSPAGSFGGGQDGASGYGGASQGGGAGYGGVSQGGYAGNADAGMPYQFQYSVNEYGNNFGHSQSSDGNQVTGRYFVQLPDGRMQTVEFKADPYNGYTADVQYEGQAQYPSSGGGSYSSGGSAGSYGGGSIGGGSVGQLPLAFNSQGNFGGALPNAPGGSYSAGPGSFSSKPY